MIVSGGNVRLRRPVWGLVLLMVVAVLTPVFAGGGGERDPNSVVVATDATWPPMEFVNEDRELVGFDVDLFKEIARVAGLTVEFQNTAWDGIFGGLIAGQYDVIISSVTITPERQQTMDFSIPYLNAGQVLIVQAADTTTTSIADLAGKTAGAQIGTTGATEIQKYPDVNLRTYDDLGLAIADLANGQIQGVVGDTPIAANFALQNADYQGRLKIVGEPYTEELYGIVVQKGNTALLNRINAALQQLINDGTVAELMDRWLR